MHTEGTLIHLKQATVTIGQELCSFCNTSSAAFKCMELPREITRCMHWQQEKQKCSEEVSEPAPTLPPTSLGISSMPTSSPTAPIISPAPVQSPEHTSTAPNTTFPFPKLPAKIKILNICTYKLHALGDYVRTIRLFGTTDLYSTQIVSVLLAFLIVIC
jgi:hypothetical protein